LRRRVLPVKSRREIAVGNESPPDARIPGTHLGLCDEIGNENDLHGEAFSAKGT